MEVRDQDRALADACIAGSKSAWVRLVEENRRHVRFAISRTAARYGADIDDDAIDDLESAVFLRLVVDEFRRLRQYRGDSTLRSWLKVLATNATVDSLRKRRPSVPVGPGEELELTCRDLVTLGIDIVVELEVVEGVVTEVVFDLHPDFKENLIPDFFSAEVWGDELGESTEVELG